jgi:hypothetical protein
MQRPLDIAQHEAAHVVVGVALGLKLRRAVLAKRDLGGGYEEHGYSWFPAGTARKRNAMALMFAAGIAWDRMVGDDLEGVDAALVRELVHSAHDVETCVTAAGALLAGLSGAHARVTRALLERDLTGADIQALARGEQIET